MAKRYIGDAVITIAYRDRGDYAGTIRAGGKTWKFDELWPAAVGFGPGISYDSPEAYDAMAGSAVSFGSNHSDEDWAPSEEVADAIAEATQGAQDESGKYEVRRSPKGVTREETTVSERHEIKGPGTDGIYRYRGASIELSNVSTRHWWATVRFRHQEKDFEATSSDEALEKAKEWIDAAPELAREAPHVADFNTVDDLVAHAGRELGATHAAGAGPETKIYFPRGGQHPYEEARVWRKGGYWHAEGPGARTGVSRLPAGAKPIGGQRRAAEAPRRHSGPQPNAESRARLAGYIAHAIMYDVSTSPNDLVKAYHLSPEEAQAVLSDRGGWFGPGGKGYAAYVKHIEKALKKKEWFSPPDPKAIPGAARAYGRYVWLLENAASGDQGRKDTSDAEDLSRELSNVGFNGWGLFVDNWPEAQRYYEAAPSVYRRHGGGETRESPIAHDFIAVDRNDRRVAGPFRSRGEAEGHVPPGGYVKFSSATRRRPPPPPSSYPMFRETTGVRREKIQEALAIIHHNGRKPEAVRAAILNTGLNDAEIDILLNAIHVKRSELGPLTSQIPYKSRRR